MNRFFFGIAFVTVILLLAGCGAPQSQAPPQQKAELNVSAAHALKEALTEIQKDYEAKNPGVKLIFNFGASGVLQSQIEQGAPADIFISAAAKQMNDLQQKDLITTATRRNLFGDELVLIVPGNSALGLTSFKDLTKGEVKKFGMGIPETVPAGQYGIEVMKALGLWDDVKDKAVQAKDIGTVLTYVETENVEAGIVFSTVAASSSKVRIVATAPAGTHQPIVFPGAVVAASKQPKAAGDFLDYLAGADGMKVFQKYGFKPVQ
ncbi:MAG: molybdate ABC transporter substrate-binding protein [Negativicutes bacterium]|nr:molybdate ABC transporter substrate-binding protein [Negativicutes bacterium]